MARLPLRARISAALLGAGLVASVDASGAEFRAIPAGSDLVVLTAQGRIEAGDDDRLRQAIRAHPGREVVLALDSEGGAILPALEMAEIVARFRIPVIVGQNAMCASACFLVFAASPDRMADETARIGVHSASLHAQENATTMALTTAMARVASTYGVPHAIVGRLVTTPPDEMAWLTSAELRTMRVAILQPGDQRRQAAPPPQAAPTAALPPVAPPPAPAPPVSASRPPLVPEEQTQGEPQAFVDGLTDRTGWETWINGLSPNARAGAEFWASQRSLPRPAPCPTTDANYEAACVAALQRLAPTDLRRRAEPEYRRGWNAFLPFAYRASVLEAFRQCRSYGRPSLERNFETIRDYNNDGVPDYLLDYGAFRCGDTVSYFCGSGGCRMELYLSGPEGHQKQFDRTVRQMQIIAGNRPVLLLALHGGNCGQIGAYDCRQRLTWNGRSFAP